MSEAPQNVSECIRLYTDCVTPLHLAKPCVPLATTLAMSLVSPPTGQVWQVGRVALSVVRVTEWSPP